MGIDPLGHEIDRIGHGPNPTALGRVGSETHLQRQVFGGSPEIVSLFFSKLVHDCLPAKSRHMQVKCPISACRYILMGDFTEAC